MLVRTEVRKSPEEDCKFHRYEEHKPSELVQRLRPHAKNLYSDCQHLFRLIANDHEGIITREKWELFKETQSKLNSNDDEYILKFEQFEFVKRMDFSKLDYDKSGNVDRYVFTMTFLMCNWYIPWLHDQNKKEIAMDDIKEEDACLDYMYGQMTDEQKKMDKKYHLRLYDLLTRKAITHKPNLMKVSQVQFEIQASYATDHSSLIFVSQFINDYFENNFGNLKLSAVHHRSKIEKILNSSITIPELLIWMILLNWTPPNMSKKVRERSISFKKLKKYLIGDCKRILNL